MGGGWTKTEAMKGSHKIDFYQIKIVQAQLRNWKLYSTIPCKSSSSERSSMSNKLGFSSFTVLV